MQRSVGIEALIPARWLSSFATVLALALGLLTSTDEADARLRDSLSFVGTGLTECCAPGDLVGSGAALTPVAETPAPAPIYPGGSLGGLFSRGDMIGGFAAGFLGSGVIGLLFGHGIVGELSGVASVLGLLFQLALIAMLARLIWTWWHDDKTDALADLSPRQLADAYGRTRNEAVPADIDMSVAPEAPPAATDGDALAKTKQPHS